MENRTFDAIVIGSGISGGWAAKELTGKGLKTLVLERGREVKHVVDYPTTMKQPWEFEHLGQISAEIRQENPIISKCYAFYEGTEQFFVKDKEHPYVQEKPFDWIRGYQTGGKSLMWARQTQRWSEYDFEGPARDGFAVPWPIGYKDVAPWYSYVEKFAGISGNKDGLPALPDGEFLPAHEMNCVEKYFQENVAKNYKDRNIIMGRAAHITKPMPIHTAQGRAQCQNRAICERGCPYGGYFSSNSSTLPWAMKTGKMTLRPHSVVHSIIYDEKKGKSTGVRVVDANTKEMIEYYAKIIFVNASTIASNALLMHSKSSRFPNGLGNDSGVLGKYIAFHNYWGVSYAEIDGFEDKYYYGRRPTAGFMPRYQNVHKQETDFLRGYLAAFSAGRGGWGRHTQEEGFGADWKEKNASVGPWHMSVQMQGETIPKLENHIRLSPDQVDKYGLPQIITSIGYDDNDERAMRHFHSSVAEMLDKSGFKNIKSVEDKRNPGLDIHEMGGCRMGKDPKTSIVNKWNQVHACKNVFVTDGAAMTSSSCVNPSITYMALTARAADFAVKEMKKGNIR